MTTRTDIVVDYNTSPRVIEVRAPSTTMNMQDWVDTVRKREDSFQGMGFPKLLNASGKEDLGGGTAVGITAANQDMLLAFEARTTPAETGTVTGSPASPVAGRQIMQDTTATFVTNSVVRGSLVINFTDNSVADVVSVDSETQLTTKTLVNGIGNTYDVADVYHVFNIIQVEALGGNLTAVDSVGSSISPVLPTAFTQVVRTLSSSATQVETGISGLTAAESAALTAVNDYVLGYSIIDYVGNDGMGWQRVQYNAAAAEIGRYNLLDEVGARINMTTEAFADAKKMIGHEIKL